MSVKMMSESVKVDDIEKCLTNGLKSIEEAAISKQEELENKVIWYAENIQNLFTNLREMECNQECINKYVEECEEKLEIQKKELSAKDQRIEKLMNENERLRIALDTEKKQQAMNDNIEKHLKELQEVKDRKSKLRNEVNLLRCTMQTLKLKSFSEQSVQTDFTPEAIKHFEFVRKILQICEDERNKTSQGESVKDECWSSKKSTKSKKRSPRDDANFRDNVDETRNKYEKTEKTNERFHCEVLRGSGFLEVTPETLDRKKDRSNTLRIHVTTEKVVKQYSCTKHSRDRSHRDETSKQEDRGVPKTTKTHKLGGRAREVRLGTDKELLLQDF